MRRIFPVCFILAAIFACSNEESGVEEKVQSNLEMRRDMLSKIDSLESVMQSRDLEPESQVTSELMQSYLRFADLFPGDKEKSPEYLYKAAALARSVELPAKAIKLYDRILNRYPNWEKGPEVAFLVAFTYDEDLNKTDLAKDAYHKVIADFPGDHWAVQAEHRLETIDMTEEELIEFLKNKAKENEGQSGT